MNHLPGNAKSTFPHYLPCGNRAGLQVAVLLAGVLAACTGHRVAAEVYTLVPGGSAAQLSVAEILQSKTVLNEPVLINGSMGTLTVGATKLSPADAAQFLKSKPGLTFLSSGTASLVVNEKVAGNELRRHFILRTAANRTTVVFSLRLPADSATATAATAWPVELPAAPGTPELAMRLDRTSTLFSTYQSPRQPVAAAVEYGEQLRLAGWKALSTDLAAGNVEYVNPKTARLALVRATPVSTGSLVSIFCSNTVKDGGP